MTIDPVCLLQQNIVRSHAAGVGSRLPIPAVRAMTVLLANALSKGRSGVRPIVIDTLLAMLARGVHAGIPSQGSVGASGDLAHGRDRGAEGAQGAAQ